MPVVFVLCVVGSYAIAQRLFDVYVMLAFGVIGFILRQLNFPMAPLVLGIVLGDLLEKNLRRGLVLSDGDLTPFFTRPISFVMFLLVAATILLNIPVVQTAATARVVSARAASCAAARRDHRVAMLISLCNEVIAEFPFERQCEFARMVGYDGIEIAPMTLSAEPHRLAPARARDACAGRPPMPASRSPACIISCVRRRACRSPRPMRRSAPARSR